MDTPSAIEDGMSTLRKLDEGVEGFSQAYHTEGAP